MSRAIAIPTKQVWIVGLLVLTALVLVLLVRPGGIGGTGIGNGGVGGTGISTGFVGRIDRFGSIYVNGVEVFYDKDIPVAYNQHTGTASDLKIGQIVSVLAVPDANGVMRARQLSVRFEIVGAVQSLATDSAVVLDQKVILPPDINPPTIGEQVAISGFRRGDGVVVASRVDIVNDPVSVSLPEMNQPFAGKADILSLSGFIQKKPGGYFLHGYALSNLSTTIRSDAVVTIVADLKNGTLDVQAVEQETAMQVPVPDLQDIVPVENRASPPPAEEKTLLAPELPTPRTEPATIESPAPDHPQRYPIVRPSPQVDIVEQQGRANPDATDANVQIENEGTDDVELAREQEDSVSPLEEPEPASEPEPTPEPVRDNQNARPVDEPPTPDRITDIVEPVVTDRPAAPVRDTRPEAPPRPERIDRPQRPDRPRRPDRPPRRD
jgi:hypothetical protein